MKNIKLNYLGWIILLLSTLSCQTSAKDEKPKIKLYDHSKAKIENEIEEKVAIVSMMDVVDMDNKGIGPISKVSLADELNQDWISEGQTIFSTKCIACHRIEQRLIGPKLAGVTQRRAPEWIMNMILNPNVMIAQDPTAKKLLVEYNNAMMINLGVTQTEARSVLEYLRSVDQ